MKAYEGDTVSTKSNNSDKPTLCNHFLKVSLHEKKLRHKALSLLMAWLTLQVVTAALWSDRHQNDDEGPRRWAGVRTGVCVRAEGRVGPRNLKVGDAHTHSEGWIRRNLVEKQACPLCADSQGVPQGESTMLKRQVM